VGIPEDEGLENDWRSFVIILKLYIETYYVVPSQKESLLSRK
jgi:hypothetical protein